MGREPAHKGGKHMKKLATLLLAGAFVLPLTLSTLALAQGSSTKGSTSTTSSAPADTGKSAKKTSKKHSKKSKTTKAPETTTTGAAK
jgi:hypothetical protein